MTDLSQARPVLQPEVPSGSSPISSSADDQDALEAPRPLSPALRTAVLLGTALLAVIVPLLASLDLDVPGRPVLAAAFFLLVPGVPLAMALRLPHPLVTASLAIASSLAVALVYGTLTIVAGWWHPVAGAWAIALLALLLSVLAARRATPPDPAATTGGSARAQGRPQEVVLFALLLVAGLTWWWSTGHVRLEDAAALGLLPVAGWRYLLALVMIAALTAYGLLRRPLHHAFLAGCALLVALLGYATVAVSDGAGSVPVGWVHVAFAQFIGENGTVARGVDARYSWPGFFSASAQLNALAGTADARSFLILASVVFTMAALPALLVIGRVVTRSWRWSWVAVFIFLLTNWYQQDYFSPQAAAFVLYTTLLATLLWMATAHESPVPAGSWAARARTAFAQLPPLPAGVGTPKAVAVGLVLALLVAAVVLGHQLTPIALLFALLIFTVTGRTRYRLLWLFGLVIFTAWFSYGATDYWIGHLRTVLGDVGQVSSSVGAGVSERLVGDPTYRSAQFVRIGWSLLLFGGAGLGLLLLLLRRRREVWLLAGLAGAPYALLAVQSYGGEGVIRTFLYASPLLAPLAAVTVRAVVQALPTRWTRTGSGSVPAVPWAAVTVVLVLATSLLVFTRGLNASFERTAPDQLVATEVLSERLRPGDQVALPASLGLTPSLAGLSVAYFNLRACAVEDLDGCLLGERPRFVLLTITQERYGELVESRPPGWVWTLGDQLVASGEYRVVHNSPDARLLELAPGQSS